MHKRSWQKRFTAGALAFSLAVPAAVLGMPAAVLAQEQSQNKNQSTLFQVFETLRDLHWSNVDEDTLLRGAVQGMLDVLNDPYSEYFTPEEYKQFVDAINQSYAGIGIRLGQDDNGYLVEEVFASTPAESAGLKKGDRIVSVDNKTTKGQQLDVVTGWLRGKEGTPVTLQIERTGQTPFSVTITRQAIKLPNLTSSMLDAETGYIRLLSFGETAGDEFDLALADLQRKGVKSLVLDVRGNGGGLMDVSLHIADRFLKSGLIVHAKERNYEHRVSADSEGVDLPLTILIDGDSASASELLAGTLQAHKRAKLIGQRSFGKGVMQAGKELENGSILKFTIGQFYFVDGTSPQGSGLKPDLSVHVRELQVPFALQVLHPERGKSVRFDLAKNKTYVNEIEITNLKTIQKNGKYYVPLRFILEAFGSEVMWNPTDQSISFKYKDRLAKLSVPAGTMTVNDQPVQRTVPFFIENGVSYLSLEALQDALLPDTLQNTGALIQIQDQ
ncbi:S41 family peptidase [Effusibacillus consociatus]|uniref:S41 family peptidase n=1 Tax=Effusibacillus consociatus TaxID=1117041 RepID=A0ABV9Q7T5_9BACL